MQKLLALVLGAALLAAAAHAGEKTFIAQSMPTLNNPWYVLYAKGSKDMAEALGATITQVTNPETTAWSPDAQINKIENLIALRPAVIEIDPTSSDGINAAIDEAKEQGIPVVVSGITVSTEVDSTITADNRQGGYMCGQYMAKALKGKGTVAVLLATPGRDIMQNRVDGFLNGLRDHPDIKVVTQQIADSERAKGVSVTESILQAHPNVDAIWAANDEMALGALEALRSVGRVGKVVVGGFDATPDAMESIQKGEMTFSADQIPYEIGVRAIAISWMVANGRSAPKAHVELPMTLVSTENVKEFIKNRVADQKAVIERVKKEYGL